MSALRKKALAELQDARKALREIPKANLSYSSVAEWSNKWGAAIRRAGVITGSEGAAWTSIYTAISRSTHETDADVWDEIRDEIVASLDETAKKVDAAHVVRPILEELILKITDTKLATLAREFNETKDHQPNFAAIGFRTLVALALVEIAKKRNPNGDVAKLKDVNLDPVIEDALAEGFLERGEKDLLVRFQGGIKKRLDIVAHKPSEAGDRSLIEKDDLSAGVDSLLNYLLKVL